jgi:hypothetical protein
MLSKSQVANVEWSLCKAGDATKTLQNKDGHRDPVTLLKPDRHSGYCTSIRAYSSPS